MSSIPQFEMDWQHIVLTALAIAGGFLCAFKPEMAHIIGPIVSAIIPLALAKNSPVISASQAAVCSGSSEDAGPTVINIGVIPNNMTVTDEGDLKISWDKTQDKS